MNTIQLIDIFVEIALKKLKKWIIMRMYIKLLYNKIYKLIIT